MIGRTVRLLGIGLATACTVPLLAAAAPKAAGQQAVAREDTCAVKSKPSGKVLQGYWENWDGASNGVHPPSGWTPITDPRIGDHGYNVVNAAFPVILSDGTVLWEDGPPRGMANSRRAARVEDACGVSPCPPPCCRGSPTLPGASQAARRRKPGACARIA